MIEYKNKYLIKRLEESTQYYSRSFSFRYYIWKRQYSIIKSFSRELETLNQGEKSIRILEVGCNDGQLIYRLKSGFDKKYNLDFIGIDLSEFCIDFAQKRKGYFGWSGCQFIVADANQLTFKNGEFDIVICSEIIEHMVNPLLTLLEIHRVLKKDGLAIITTPNKNGSILAKILRAIDKLSFNMIRKEKQKRMGEYIDEKKRLVEQFGSDEGVSGVGHGHISVKNKNEWLEVFKEAGFRILSISGTSGILLGDPYFDEHRVLFGLTVVLDTLLERFAFSYFWSETLFFELRK